MPYHIVSGNSNRPLALGVCAALRAYNPGDPCPTLDGDVGRFADGEVSVRIAHNVRSQDVFVVHPTCPPVNDAVMELALLTQALKLASAERVTLVIPYFGYARQDRKTAPRTPISAAAVAQILAAFQPHRVVTVDLHCGQIQGFFHNIPVDNLYAQRLIATHVQALYPAGHTLCVVSPDAGGVPRAKSLARLLGTTELVTVIKHRSGPNQVADVKVIGDVRGRVCVIIDDIVDTAGTVCASAATLRELGAAEIVVAATHGLFSGPAHERLRDSQIDHVVVTNTVPQRPYPWPRPTMHVLDIAPLLAEAIHRLHTKQSLSVLFE